MHPTPRLPTGQSASSLLRLRALRPYGPSLRQSCLIVEPLRFLVLWEKPVNNKKATARVAFLLLNLVLPSSGVSNCLLKRKLKIKHLSPLVDLVYVRVYTTWR